MVTPKLFQKIMDRVSDDPEELKRVIRCRYELLNRKLEKQLNSQRMTDDVLNKKCTL